MTAIVKGYAKKPASAAVKSVLKGFTDNPFLTAKHKAARKKASKLRHDFSGKGDHINNSDNSGVIGGDGNDEEEQ